MDDDERAAKARARAHVNAVVRARKCNVRLVFG